MFDIPTRLIPTDRNGDCLLVVEDTLIKVIDRAISIPCGFRSDGISVPRIFWALVSPKTNPASKVAGIVHDYIYRVKPYGWSRAMADKAFYLLLLYGDFGKLRAVACFLAVRLFGWMAWDENRHSKCAGCPMDCTKCYRWNGEDGNE